MNNPVKLNIIGMKCGGCSAAVEEALKGVADVDAVEVRLEENIALISGNADIALLTAAIETAGFKVEQ